MREDNLIRAVKALLRAKQKTEDLLLKRELDFAIEGLREEMRL